MSAAVRMKENKRTWQFALRNTAHHIIELNNHEQYKYIPTCT